MSSSTIAVDESKPVAVSQSAAAVTAETNSHVGDLLELVKPRISSMVLVTVALAVFVASNAHPDAWVLFHCLLGTALVATSSGAFNQWLERHTDAKMKRTNNRPLPAGRMTVTEVLSFGILTLVAGIAYLSLTVGGMATAWAIATWVVYVCIYTPMKQQTSWNTTVGAISGAMPILIGASAVQSAFSWNIVAMFSVLFFWQFPHFIAIAWIYRHDYSQAGLRMVTTTDPTGKSAGNYSVLGAFLLVAASLLPLMAITHQGVGIAYAAAAIALGIYQIRAAWVFMQSTNEKTARRLLIASIIYLPLALGLIAVQTAF